MSKSYNSMQMVKSFLDSESILRITKSKQKNLWEMSSSVVDFVPDKYKPIWSDKGFSVQARDKDTGNVKNITFRYDERANFDFVEYGYSFESEELDKGAQSYIDTIGQVIEQVIFGQRDSGPYAPKHYDLDWEAENIHHEEGMDINPDIRETYWDYDVEFVFGNFVLFKDTKKSYAMEAQMRAVKNGIDKKFDEKKPVSRYVVLLPVAVNYIKVDRPEVAVPVVEVEKVDAEEVQHPISAVNEGEIVDVDFAEVGDEYAKKGVTW